MPASSRKRLSSMATGMLLLLATLPAIVGKGPPKLRAKYQREQVFGVGETMRLVCPTDSDPESFIEWQKNGSTIHLGWERFRTKRDGSLQVRDLEPSDKGVYLCRATNGFGSIDFKYLVFVISPSNTTEQPSGELNETNPPDEAPSFRSEHMRDEPILQPVGSTVRLRCRAEGSPRPQITWYKDGRIVHSVPETGNGDALSGSRHTLKVPNLTEEDSGRYMCLVQNRAGSINFTYTLEVIARFSETPEFIAPHLENVSALVGASVTFQCHMKSNIQPHIQWLKRVDFPHDQRYRNTTISVHGQKFIALQRGVVLAQKDGTYLSKLVLHSVTDQDSGLYICAATNLHGFAFRSAQLTVKPSQSIDVIDADVTSPSFSPLLPIVITIIVVIIVVITCVTMALYLMRLKKSSTAHQPGPRGFKTAPFRAQKALSGFSAPEKKVGGGGGGCLDHNRYTFLGPHSTPPPLDDTTSPAQTSDPDEGQHEHQHHHHHNQHHHEHHEHEHDEHEEHIVRVIFKTSCRRSGDPPTSDVITPFAGVTTATAPATVKDPPAPLTGGRRDRKHVTYRFGGY